MEQVPVNTAGATSSQGVITLAQLLNILWRRRLTIVLMTVLGLVAGIVYLLVHPPLYRAMATVRPGITNYDDRGTPQRTWRIKDVVRWYKRAMYADGVKEKLGWQDRPAPVIMAEFIPRGVGVQGGDVVTLSTLSTSPGEAEQILDAAITAFNEYAEINSVGNNISLARESLRNQIAQLDNERQDIEVKRDLLNLDIERQREELVGLEIREKALDLKIRRHLAVIEASRSKAAHLDEGVASADSSMNVMAEYLRLLHAKQAAQPSLDSLITRLPETDRLPFLWLQMAQDKTAVAGRLLLNTLDHLNLLWQDKLKAEDLRNKSRLEELDKEKDLLEEGYAIQKERKLAELKIREMEINRDKALDQELQVIDDQQRDLESKLEVLTSLEKIGHTIVTDRPVRPRKARALGLLTLAGLLAGFGLALVREYLERNREIIFADRIR